LAQLQEEEEEEEEVGDEAIAMLVAGNENEEVRLLHIQPDHALFQTCVDTQVSSGSEPGPPPRPETPDAPSLEELLAVFNGPPPGAEAERSKWLWYGIGTLLRAQPRPPEDNARSAAEEPEVLAFGTLKRQLALHVLPAYPKCQLYRVSVCMRGRPVYR
jgi:hypothetical protein